MDAEEEAAVGKLNKNNYVMEVEDIVSRILSMLPVKSLLICRAVCKDWRRLISSPDFIRLHLNKSKENPNIMHQGAAATPYSLDFGKFMFYRKYPSYYESEMLTKMKMGAVINGLLFWVSPRYSSSGLPQLHGRHQIYIHNPAIQRVGLICETRSGRLQPQIAVAFVPGGRINEYKVYAMFPKNDRSRYYDDCDCEVYCSVTKSWKLIGDVPPAACWVRYSRSVNGVVYWVVEYQRGERRPLMGMIATDWNGSVTTMSLPGGVTNEFMGLLNLIEFEGRLSLIFCHDNLFDLWVLKDDGINNGFSRVKRCCSAMPVDIKYPDSEAYFVVVRKSEIFFLLNVRDDVKVVIPFTYLVYNVDNATWRGVVIPTFIKPALYVFDFTESLLPIPGGDKLRGY